MLIKSLLKAILYISLLSTLRDAVLAAEHAFGDVLENAMKILESFNEVHNAISTAAANEDCTFKCTKKGVSPRKNKNHVPSSDGCGTFGLNVNKDFVPFAPMTKCCDAHDICYDTCNSKKQACDLEFKECLYKYCDNNGPGQLGEQGLKACKGAANVLYSGTVALGCKPYLDAQSKACFCSNNEQIEHKKKRVRGDEL